MRIIQILPTLQAGGAETFVASLSYALRKRGNDVLIILLGGIRDERGEILFQRLKNAGVIVLGHRYRAIKTIYNILLIKNSIKNSRPDIVQVNLRASEIALICSRILFRLSGPKYIRRLASTKIDTFAFSLFDLIVDKMYQTTICCSDAVRQAYAKKYNCIYSTNLFTINNGVDCDIESLNDNEKLSLRESFSIPQSSLVICHIGRMVGTGKYPKLDSEPKAQDVLIRAFAKAFKGDSTKILLLAGDGRLRSRLEHLAIEMQVQSQVKFLGRVREPWSVLAASDLFCLPSRYEGFPNSLIEAAITGLPVVASDIPEIRNLMLGPEWQLIPPKNIIELSKVFIQFSNNPQYQISCAKKAAIKYKTAYSMNTCCIRYEESYCKAT